jgi:hypothetical protein
LPIHNRRFTKCRANQNSGLSGEGHRRSKAPSGLNPVLISRAVITGTR